MTSKLEKLQQEITVREENEVLREKYIDMLDRLKALYENGHLTLSTKNIEKVNLYLQEQKVLKAAGIDPEEQRAIYLEKNAKLFKRKYMKKGPIDESSLDELNQGPNDKEHQQKTLLNDQSVIDVEFFEDNRPQNNLEIDNQHDSSRPIIFNRTEESVEEDDNRQISQESLDSLQLQILALENQLKAIGNSSDLEPSTSKDNLTQQKSLPEVNFVRGENFKDTGFIVVQEHKEDPAKDPKIQEMRDQLKLLLVERDKQKAESNAVLIVHHKQEKSLHQVAIEREKRHKKMEQKRNERGYKKLRATGKKGGKFEKVAPTNERTPVKNNDSNDFDRIQVEDIDEEQKEIEDSNQKLVAVRGATLQRHIDDEEIQQ